MMMRTAPLADLVRDYFVRRAATYGLDPGNLTVEYVLNWGGFVNSSWRIRDPSRGFHLKLGLSGESRDALRRWQALAPMLAAHHAPPVLDWIDLGPTAGLLFPLLDGISPAAPDPPVLAEVLPALRRLNNDGALRSALTRTSQVTARHSYLATFHERFTEDLRGIREAPPPFVHPSLLDALEHEAASLAEQVNAEPAFSELLTKPVHGDLWLNNLLWVSPAEWYLVDWDDLGIGDPAADLATLIGPTAADPAPLKAMPGAAAALTDSERDRLPLLGRATLLDWVIDPVADWVEAVSAPAHLEAVRHEKERVHGQALARYRSLYGMTGQGHP